MAFLNNISNRVGTTVNNQLGKGINSLLGGGFPSEDVPLYENFLYNILSDANNAVTESSYWVVFFSRATEGEKKSVKQSITSTIKEGIQSDVSNEFGISTKKYNPSGRESNLEVSPWKTGAKTLQANDQFFNNLQNAMMLVQGIEIPGDGFDVNRGDTMNVGGFLRPPTTGIRNDMPEMEITFLENNSSVTDLVLRPWVVHSSYASLKFANRATITCYNLTRSPSGFRVRKQFRFHNAVPISIDAEQYDYSSADSFGKRQTKFIFTHYDLDEGSSMEDSLLGSVGNFLLQKTRDVVSGVVEGGVDVVTGGANQVYTNVKGSFVESVDDFVQDVQSRVREYGKNAEESIINDAQRQIDKAFGYSPDKDNIMRGGEDFPTSGTPNNPSPRIPVDASKDDARVSAPTPPRSSGVVNNARYTLVDIDSADTVDSSALNLKEVTINNNGGGLNTSQVLPPKEDIIRR